MQFDGSIVANANPAGNDVLRHGVTFSQQPQLQLLSWRTSASHPAGAAPSAGWNLLDVVVSQGAAIRQLLSSKDQSLLVGWDALLVLDLGLHVVNGVVGLYLQSDGLASQGLHKDLHPTTQAQHQGQGGLVLLDVALSSKTELKRKKEEDIHMRSKSRDRRSLVHTR